MRPESLAPAGTHDGSAAGEAPPVEIHFAGPDCPPRVLRDLLEARVHAVPPGGRIDWVTYYFRDRPLARALLEARRRGVQVSVTIDGRPRTAHASDRVVEMLAGPAGLGDGFRAIRMWRLPTPSGRLRNPHLHEKIYCFSHPAPMAFIGSFNPSGDDPEEAPEIVEEIRDQDRGHNLLVGFGDPVLVRGLMEHVRWVHQARLPGLAGSLSTPNRKLTAGPTEIHFLPRIGRHPVVRLLAGLGAGARVAIAGSHVKGAGVVRVLVALARRGVTVHVLAEQTLRRVPTRVEDTLRAAGITVQRILGPEGIPMHDKFVLVEHGGRRRVAFGSFNWTTRSFWLNREVCAISEDPGLLGAFQARWQMLWPGEAL